MTVEECYLRRHNEVSELYRNTSECDRYSVQVRFSKLQMPQNVIEQYKRSTSGILWRHREDQALAFKRLEQALVELAGIESAIELMRADREERVNQARALYEGYLLPNLKTATENLGHADVLFSPRSTNPNRHFYLERKQRAEALVRPLINRGDVSGLDCRGSEWQTYHGYKCIGAIEVWVERNRQQCDQNFRHIDCPITFQPTGPCRRSAP